MRVIRLPASLRLTPAGARFAGLAGRRTGRRGGRWSWARSRPGTRRWTCRRDWFRRGGWMRLRAGRWYRPGPGDTAQWPGGRRCRGDRGRCAGSEHRAALRDGWPAGCSGGTSNGRVAGLRPGGGPVQVGPGGRAAYPAGPAQHRQGDHLRRLGRDAPAGSQPGEFPDRPDRPASPVPAPGTGTVTTLGRRRPRGNPGAARRPGAAITSLPATTSPYGAPRTSISTSRPASSGPA